MEKKKGKAAKQPNVVAKKRPTRLKQVKDFLLKHKSITTWQAIDNCGDIRLAVTICTLRKRSWAIGMKVVETPKGRCAKYSLLKAGV